MSSSSLEYVSRGLTKAFERRRAMQQQTMQLTQVVVQNQKVDNSVSDASATTTTKLSEEQYQITIIQKMLIHINQKKEEINHD